MPENPVGDPEHRNKWHFQEDISGSLLHPPLSEKVKPARYFSSHCNLQPELQAKARKHSAKLPFPHLWTPVTQEVRECPRVFPDTHDKQLSESDV